MVIVDTSVWIDVFAGRETPSVTRLRHITQHESVAVGDLMLCEVLQGVRTEAESKRARERLLRLHLFEMVGLRNALAAADNYRALRRRGITVRGTVDCLIATFCIENSLPLLHNNRDFDPFEEHLGLQVVR
jgi:predicted nucleic acid-binding protein